MNFCIECGEKLTFVIPETDNRHRWVCVSCTHIHYENPNVVVGVLPIYEDKILICKRAIEPRKGYWTLPAGFMELNETMREGAKREAKEEAHANVELENCYVIYNVPKVSQVHCIYLGRLLSDDVKAGDETEAVQLVAVADIPWNEIAFSSITFTLKHYVQDLKTGIFPLHEGDLLDH